jgi:GMP synthase-like glutamine amidotransferase
VPAPPAGFENLGWTTIAPVQGMLKPGHVLTMQGHPEFTSDVVKEIIRIRSERNIFSPQFTNKSILAAESESDGVWIG